MNNNDNNNSNDNNSNANGFESFANICENSSGFITIINNSFQFSFDDIWTNDTVLENEQKPQRKVIHGNVEGYDCIKCGDFYPMAELNMPNKTFCCYSCRNGLSTYYK